VEISLLLFIKRMKNNKKLQRGFNERKKLFLSFIISQLNVIKYTLISGLECTPFVRRNISSSLGNGACNYSFMCLFILLIHKIDEFLSIECVFVVERHRRDSTSASVVKIFKI
jgi:hypothetical protein